MNLEANDEARPGSSIFLVGPTASGKSAAALELAGRIGGEIISVDSMQVYRGLDIGTAKPTAQERGRVPHHLVDIAELDDSFDAARFVDLARAAETEIHRRGRTAIFCGGTGLYVKAYLDGLGAAPPASPALRDELERIPLSVLLEELRDRDPLTFQRIDRQNPRRVVRAVEVIRLTGRPYSEKRAAWAAAAGPNAGGSAEGRRVVHGLTRPPDELRLRIDARVDEMFARGLVAEVQGLLARGLEKNRTAMQAIGYRQVVEHLHGGRGLAETIELVKIRTRQFARRQMTWFRRQLSVRWIEAAGPLEIADRLQATL